VIFVDVPLGASDARVFVERRLEVATVGFRLEQFDSVDIDDVAVGRMATEHLLDLGHRRIGVIEGLAENPRHFDVPGLRAEGCVAALADHGLALDPDLVVGGNFSIDGGHEAMVALLGRPDPPTAVFAMSDEMAFGAIKAAADLGVAVPADLSVVGVDDHDMAAILGLTTVHQSVADLGAQAARLLIERLAQPDRPVEHCRTDVHLEIRSTTAPPATRS
jgi:DNA-binding LacI/PurR family transcriptional regulator